MLRRRGSSPTQAVGISVEHTKDSSSSFRVYLMSPQPQTTHSAPAAADEPDTPVSASRPADARVIDAAADATVAIELDFNAFADDVPPDRHARRVAQSSDPSVQDFADQVLELAALRMELKRLTRECEGLRHAVHVRDTRLQALQDQVRGLRNGSGESSQQSSHAAVAYDAASKQELSHTLDLLLANAQATAAVEQISTVTLPPPAPVEVQAGPELPKRQLIPVDHEGEPILLSRDIMTIGRTRDKDICIPSKAVSRDHARLVMSTRSVTVFDMDSANGCFVNDQPVKRHKLRENDVLRIGDRSYRFAGPQHAADAPARFD